MAAQRKPFEGCELSEQSSDSVNYEEEFKDDESEQLSLTAADFGGESPVNLISNEPIHKEDFISSKIEGEHCSDVEKLSQRLRLLEGRGLYQQAYETQERIKAIKDNQSSHVTEKSIKKLYSILRRLDKQEKDAIGLVRKKWKNYVEIRRQKLASEKNAVSECIEAARAEVSSKAKLALNKSPKFSSKVLFLQEKEYRFVQAKMYKEATLVRREIDSLAELERGRMCSNISKNVKTKVESLRRKKNKRLQVIINKAVNDMEKFHLFQNREMESIKLRFKLARHRIACELRALKATEDTLNSIKSTYSTFQRNEILKNSIRLRTGALPSSDRAILSKNVMKNQADALFASSLKDENVVDGKVMAAQRQTKESLESVAILLSDLRGQTELSRQELKAETGTLAIRPKTSEGNRSASRLNASLLTLSSRPKTAHVSRNFSVGVRKSVKSKLKPNAKSRSCFKCNHCGQLKKGHRPFSIPTDYEFKSKKIGTFCSWRCTKAWNRNNSPTMVRWVRELYIDHAVTSQNKTG